MYLVCKTLSNYCIGNNNTNHPKWIGVDPWNRMMKRIYLGNLTNFWQLIQTDIIKILIYHLDFFVEVLHISPSLNSIWIFNLVLKLFWAQIIQHDIIIQHQKRSIPNGIFQIMNTLSFEINGCKYEICWAPDYEIILTGQFYKSTNLKGPELHPKFFKVFSCKKQRM